MIIILNNPDFQKREGEEKREYSSSKLILLFVTSLVTKAVNDCKWLLNPTDELLIAMLSVVKDWADNLRLRTFRVVAMAGSI